ncbi:outer membrane protein transport protein [uncultured Proteiniphilum sp.]|uniref:OmpP1/FadL family transporter n=1 Tax=uncultured Proteiniphilum sp. TaxID=497637 RepID=UPI002616F2B3|nr:outer membrane protein transport protein [uncultured Proteiniphilum sp.]
MKKISYILFSLFILSGPLFSQSELDALRFSREDLHGTARAMSMGGAFGALGGDLTGVSVNPAGIAVYRSSEVMGTLNLSREASVVGSSDAHKNRFNMDNIGFVGYFPLRNDVMPLINFGFSYNKLKSFDKEVFAMGSPNNTLIDYMVRESAGIKPSDLELGKNLPDPFLDQPWLSVLGYNSYLIRSSNDGASYTPVNTRGATPYNEIRTYEKGYIDNYDFTVGTTINNVLNVGMSLSIKDIFYDLASDYLEDFDDEGEYTLTNWLTVNGAGVGAKFGAIYRPVNAFRIGLAWHTPTWYALTETYEAQLDDDMGAFVTDPNYNPEDMTYSAVFTNNYDLKTPGKIVASVATVLGNNFIASLDYEVVDYSNMKLKVPSNSMDDPSWYDQDNEYITEDHKLTSTVKVGMEYRFTPQFSGRLGYAWMQNPYDADLVKFGDAVIAGSNSIFRIEGDTNYFTGGVGYRFNRNFYLDLAIVYKTQKDDLYPFPNYYVDDVLDIDATPFSLKNNSVRGLLTLGYRF